MGSTTEGCQTQKLSQCSRLPPWSQFAFNKPSVAYPSHALVITIQRRSSLWAAFNGLRWRRRQVIVCCPLSSPSLSSFYPPKPVSRGLSIPSFLRQCTPPDTRPRVRITIKPWLGPVYLFYEHFSPRQCTRLDSLYIPPIILRFVIRPPFIRSRTDTLPFVNVLRLDSPHLPLYSRFVIRPNLLFSNRLSDW
ncbi:hypothetical protein BV22DRAFT_848611 [Leucogyrophana mollusca]|uniref:Uncharacterized protein n=1 Tax=Leucogyrophana mollusca TaxID=85980 RepID=A0ACB8B362_9AGAM|nr:hypothetical protein BV22DRAFT_848611 [Leucogyrophana mollusca]